MCVCVKPRQAVYIYEYGTRCVPQLASARARIAHYTRPIRHAHRRLISGATLHPGCACAIGRRRSYMAFLVVVSPVVSYSLFHRRSLSLEPTRSDRPGPPARPHFPDPADADKSDNAGAARRSHRWKFYSKSFPRPNERQTRARGRAGARVRTMLSPRRESHSGTTQCEHRSYLRAVRSPAPAAPAPHRSRLSASPLCIASPPSLRCAASRNEKARCGAAPARHVTSAQRRSTSAKRRARSNDDDNIR